MAKKMKPRTIDKQLILNTSREIVKILLTIREFQFNFLGDEQWWIKLSFLNHLFEHLNKYASS